MMWGFDDRGTKIMAALAIVIGMFGSAAILGDNISNIKKSDRYVTMRGLSEREVKADLAVWPIRVRTASDELGEATKAAEAAKEKVLSFLIENGISKEDIASQTQRVEDRKSNEYSNEKALRYMVEYTILVRSTNVDKVREISQMTDKLASVGIVLASQGSWSNAGPQFVFTKLNELKPEMLAEATKSAREGAAQFAKDSDSKVGNIRRASQGLFSIQDRDRAIEGAEADNTIASDLYKKVRVVVTVDYYLE